MSGAALKVQTDAVATASVRRRRPHATLIIGIVLVGLVVLTAVVSLVWLPYPLSDISGDRLEPPSPTHLLGTDRLGRDLLSQLMLGSRIALTVGAGAVLIAAVIGISLGLVAAFARPWLDDVSWALPSVIAVQAWNSLGWAIVIYLSGLAGVPSELREAAVIDGASPWQAFWRVVFPMLAPSFTSLTVITFIQTTRVFDVVYVPRETVLLEQARAAGHPAANGAEMLIAQAAEAWVRWTGRPDPSDVMRRAVQPLLEDPAAAP